MKNVIFKGIKALAILFVLYILISLIVPPIFQKEPIELEGAEFAGTGVTERVLCIDDNREALIWRLRLIDRAENEIILSTFDFRVDNSGKDMIAALNEAAERGVNTAAFIAVIAPPGIGLRVDVHFPSLVITDRTIHIKPLRARPPYPQVKQFRHIRYVERKIMRLAHEQASFLKKYR